MSPNHKRVECMYAQVCNTGEKGLMSNPTELVQVWKSFNKLTMWQISSCAVVLQHFIWLPTFFCGMQLLIHVITSTALKLGHGWVMTYRGGYAITYPYHNSTPVLLSLIVYENPGSSIYRANTRTTWHKDLATWSSFYLDGLTLIPAWISNHMPSKVWDEITYPLPNFSACSIKVWEWISSFIPHFMIDVITYPCWD